MYGEIRSSSCECRQKVCRPNFEQWFQPQRRQTLAPKNWPQNGGHFRVWKRDPLAVPPTVGGPAWGSRFQTGKWPPFWGQFLGAIFVTTIWSQKRAHYLAKVWPASKLLSVSQAGSFSHVLGLAGGRRDLILVLSLFLFLSFFLFLSLPLHPFLFLLLSVFLFLLLVFISFCSSIKDCFCCVCVNLWLCRCIRVYCYLCLCRCFCGGLSFCFCHETNARIV